MEVAVASATAFGSPLLAGVHADDSRAASLVELMGAGDAAFFVEEEMGASVVLPIAMAVAGELASDSEDSCLIFAGVHLEKKAEMDFC